MTKFIGKAGRDDAFYGGDDRDAFWFSVADLDGNDILDGGAGDDTLRFLTPGAISASVFANLRGIERILLAVGNNSIVLDNAMVASAAGGVVSIVGNSGDDLVYGSRLTSANAIDVTAGGGADLLLGGSGSDIFRFDISELTSADVVDGGYYYGSGQTADTLVLTGTGELVADALKYVTDVERIVLPSTGMRFTLPSGFLENIPSRSLEIVGGDGGDIIDASTFYEFGSQSLLKVNAGAGDDIVLGAAIDPNYLTYDSAIVDGGLGRDIVDVRNMYGSSITYDPNDIRLVSRAGTLIVNGAIDFDANPAEDQTRGDDVVVQGMISVDASGSSESVKLLGNGTGTLTGGSAADVIENAQVITGGGGADRLVGSSIYYYSTSFILNAGDFAAGETITALSYSSSIWVLGDNDLRLGQFSGIYAVYVGNYNSTDVIHLTMSGEQAQSVSYVQTPYRSEAVIDVIAESALNLERTSFFGYSQTSTTRIFGSADNDRIILTYDAVDVIRAGGGDDTIGAKGDGALIDGGAGSDTFLMPENSGTAISFDLANRADQGIGDTMTLRNFENVDLSRQYYGQSYQVYGSSAANVLIGSSGIDRFDGRAGDDVIRGGNGADTLTGGAGRDRFEYRGQYDGGDTITDFDADKDTLVFDRANYRIAGNEADVRRASGRDDIDIPGVDLFVFTGRVLDSVDDVSALLTTTSGNDYGSGIFIAGRSSEGHTMLYHVNSTANFYYYGNISLVADLGTGLAPRDLTLDNFMFL